MPAIALLAYRVMRPPGPTAAALAPAAGSVQADFNNDGADDLAAGYRWAERGAARNGAAAVPA
jgi:hypothetical protein